MLAMVSTVPNRPALTLLASELRLAIEHHKRYPLAARRMGREGVTQVAFELHPDGHIEELEVALTSGARALDNAALRAVHAIEPFAGAADYLDDSARFRIDIEFQLR